MAQHANYQQALTLLPLHPSGPAYHHLADHMQCTAAHVHSSAVCQEAPQPAGRTSNTRLWSFKFSTVTAEESSSVMEMPPPLDPARQLEKFDLWLVGAVAGAGARGMRLGCGSVG